MRQLFTLFRIFLIAVAFLISQSTNAQFSKLLKQAKKEINKEVKKEIKDAVKKGSDKIFDRKKKEKKGEEKQKPEKKEETTTETEEKETVENKKSTTTEEVVTEKSQVKESNCVYKTKSALKDIKNDFVKMEDMDFPLEKRMFYDPEKVYKEFQKCKEEHDYNFTDLNSEVEEMYKKYNKFKERNEKNKKKGDNYEAQINDAFIALSYLEDDYPKIGLREDLKDCSDLFKDIKNSKKIVVDKSSQLNLVKTYYEDNLKKIDSPDFLEYVLNNIDQEKNSYNKDLYLTKFLKANKYLVNNIYFDNPNLIKIIKYIEKINAKDNRLKNEAISKTAISNFHKENANKIYFTKNLNLNPAKASSSDFTTNFTIGDDIKAIIYLGNTFDNQFGKNEGLVIYMNNTRIGHYLEPSERKKSYVEINIVADAKHYRLTNAETYPSEFDYMRFIQELPERDKKVTFKANNIETAFTINGDDEQGRRRVSSKLASFKDKFVSQTPLPKAGMRNSNYEKQLVNTFNAMGWEENFVKCIIMSNDFGTLRNQLGVVLGRTLKVAMVSKKPDGGCMYQEFTVVQDKIGSNSYSKTFRRESTGSQRDISCNKVN